MGTFLLRIFRRAIAEPDRARALQKACSLVDAALAIQKAGSDTTDDDEQQHGRMCTRGQRKRLAIAAAPFYLTDRVERDDALPQLELTHCDEQLRATITFVVGMKGNETRTQEDTQYLPRELFMKMLGNLMHTLADKGSEGQA